MTDRIRPILLIGAEGQVGWELRRALAPFGPIRAPAREELDLADPDLLRRELRDAQPGLVVNAAAYTAVDRAESEPDLALAVNGRAPGVLAEEAKRLGAALVHYSTDYVFDGRAKRPYREDDPTGPLNAYGRSKLEGEDAISAVGGAYLILRSGWIYSARRSNFLTTIRRLAAERDELRIVDDQHGTPTWARGIAEATAEILGRSGAATEPAAFRESGGIYHLAAAGETTWCGFAREIVAQMRASGEEVRARAVIPISSADYPTPASRPAWSVLDCGKLNKTFSVTLPDWRGQLRRCLGR